MLLEVYGKYYIEYENRHVRLYNIHKWHSYPISEEQRLLCHISKALTQDRAFKNTYKVSVVWNHNFDGSRPTYLAFHTVYAGKFPMNCTLPCGL